MKGKVHTIHEEDINEMLKYNKELLEEPDHQSRQISIKELQIIIQEHQDKIDRMDQDLSSMLKKYLPTVKNKMELEREGHRECLKQNPEISQSESKIARESKEYIAAVKAYDAKSAPKFYEVWKKNSITNEIQQLDNWRESIHSMNHKLANEKSIYLKTPSARQFIDHYIKEKITEQDNNQKRIQEMHGKRNELSDLRTKIANINFTVSQIKNNSATITMNGNLKDLNHVASQSEKIKNQLVKIQFNENTFTKSHGLDRYR